MLSDYKGPSNSTAVFQHLVGEKITAAFRDGDGKVWIVGESGHALVFGGISGPAYWTVGPDDVEHVISRRRRDIEQKLSELRDLPGVRLP